MHATMIDKHTFTEVSGPMCSQNTLKYMDYSSTSTQPTWRFARFKDLVCQRAIPSILLWIAKSSSDRVL